jgi:segregation and condensation protein B
MTRKETSGKPAEPSVESVIEAVLFASDEPVNAGRLAGIVGVKAGEVNRAVKALNGKYSSCGNSFRIEQIAGGFQMLTLECYKKWVEKLIAARSEGKLSGAALETLAIIAYRQPIIRADIEAVRGVAVGEVLRSLIHKGMVRITGRAEVLGRPMLYGTTRKFLRVFGLNSLKDLPQVGELKKPPE